MRPLIRIGISWTGQPCRATDHADNTGSRHHRGSTGRQAGGGEREGGHWTESVMKTDSSQLVTVVAAGHGLETCGAMRTQTRTETLDTSQQ